MQTQTSNQTTTPVPFQPLIKAQLLAKGCTIESVTASMHRMETIINFYNKKYDFDPLNAPEDERREWRSALNLWDTFKSCRDTLKAH